MQKYSEQGSRELIDIRCNCCGRPMRVERGIVKEGCLHIKVPFGFFTERDGQVHEFDLCESCYNKIITGFEIPVAIEERTELL